jgi:hypothetical protein
MPHELRNEHFVVDLKQEWTNFFHKGHKISIFSWLLLRQSSCRLRENEWVRLCTNKILVPKTGGKMDSAQGSYFVDPWTKAMNIYLAKILEYWSILLRNSSKYINLGHPLPELGLCNASWTLCLLFNPPSGSGNWNLIFPFHRQT